jgi:dTDP-4-amino-4,6-dideoxygalactose transaminase
VAPIDAIEELLEGTGVTLIDDAAQCFGARCKDQYVGTFGECGIVSTSQGKSLPGSAGGVLVTNNRRLYERAAAISLRKEKATIVLRRTLANWVWMRFRRYTLALKKTSDSLFSQNYNAKMQAQPLSNLDAAMALVQLERLERNAIRRRERVRKISDCFDKAVYAIATDLNESSMALSLILIVPSTGPHVEKMISELRSIGIEAARGYEPLHRRLDLPSHQFPKAEALWNQMILIPLTRTIKGEKRRAALQCIFKSREM